MKVIQLMYAYYQNGGKNVDTAEKELLFSLSKAHDLYFYLLQLMVDVTKYAAETVEQKEQLNIVAHKEEVISHRFVDNQFIAQLRDNKELTAYREHLKHGWDLEINYLKSLYETITSTEAYQEYMQKETVDYNDDRELWRKLYKQVVEKDEKIDDILEELSLYWNDDKEIIDTFVVKTIKRFDPATGADQELLPEYKDEEDKEFAVRLFRRAIMNDEYYRDLLAQSVRNWEFSRLAFMDVVIMQVALAEILSFPLIPVSVSINEYVEIAKYYSTPKSPAWVNGIIDNVVKRLIQDGKLQKQV